MPNKSAPVALTARALAMAAPANVHGSRLRPCSTCDAERRDGWRCRLNPTVSVDFPLSSVVTMRCASRRLAMVTRCRLCKRETSRCHAATATLVLYSLDGQVVRPLAECCPRCLRWPCRRRVGLHAVRVLAGLAGVRAPLAPDLSEATERLGLAACPARSHRCRSCC